MYGYLQTNNLGKQSLSITNNTIESNY